MDEPVRGVGGELARLYDVFVDWPGRLGRELPGLERRLRAAGARRVLDVGCGTGRHVRALRERGYDAHGADVSEEMLAQAREHVGEAGRLHAWRLGEEPPASLRDAAPFDAALALGNVWPQLAAEQEARRALDDLARLLRPGGLVVLGLKAFAVRAAAGDPHLPLLRREHGGRPLWFVRFVDFQVPPRGDGVPLADLHMAILAGDAGAPRAEALEHRATRVRVWEPGELARWLTERGLADVRVSASLADADAPPVGEDVVASGTTR